MPTKPTALGSLAIALALASCTSNAEVTAQPEVPVYRELGISLVDIDEADFQIVSKTAHDLHVLAFWAAWCTACRSMVPELEILWKDMRDRGLNVYAVSIDGPDSQAQVAGLANVEGWELPVLLDRETSLLSSYNPKGDIPFYVVLDADGQAIRSHQGYVTGDMSSLRTFLDARLPTAGHAARP
jgi:thioredoxin-like negative regulator of GroEL